ncbi:C25 family cysteine peptidase [Pontibacter sp. BT731]|uniref:putative type IX secretion system sortase PorU2 n=1 Tax=Pontibacter coccineus TaxID=3063328 RepID=UPI0026E18FEE|nr:C25 family cysteine peptidase [Pontibacter sp. BT731]MDO6389164.1 C25 family cysteine peptidase [Pontibacter sp. BT731]
MKINRLFLQFLLASVLAFGLQAAAQAQSPTPYGNEWIDYNKTYYKLKVVNTGLHRLSHGFLDSLGLAGTNPQHFQLFRRGREVAIHVAGEADGRLDREDFIEFYGERNDGRLDQDLYKNPAHQPHQLYSLYTDTAAYFLTVNPAGGKRMQQVNPSPAGKTAEPYHLQKVTQYFVDRYYYGQKHGTIDALLAWMDEGEGYTSVAARVAKNYDIPKITNVEATGPKPRVEAVVGGVNKNLHAGVFNIIPQTGVARAINRFSIEGDKFLKISGAIEYSDIFSDGKIRVQTLPDATPSNDVTLSYVSLIFAQKTQLVGNSVLFSTDSTRTPNPYYVFNGADAAAIAYDVTDPFNPIRIEGHMNAGGKGVVVPTENNTHKVLLANTNKAFKAVGKAEMMRFRNINTNAHNYIILTNKRLMKAVGGSQMPAPKQYAAYRAAAAGGGYDTLVVQIDQVVNQFHYGEFSSNAVRKFMTFMLTSDREKQLFIIGKGLKYAWEDYRSIHNNKYSFYHIGDRHPKVHEMDLVPTGVMPSSDVFFSSDFRNNRYEPRVPTGRLSATTGENIIAYLNKVKEHESLPGGLAWRKNILQLGGGANGMQQNQYADWLTNYRRIAEGPLLGANVIEKYRRDFKDYTTYVNVSDEVNAGISLLTFFGHSAIDVTDVEIGFASSNLNGYRNKGKYPAIIMNGCYSGDASIYNKISFGEDWLMTPDRGAISFMAQSYIGGDGPLNEFSNRFYQIAFSDNQFYGRTIGEIHKETIRRYIASSSLYQRGDHVATMTQMVLQGDPAVKLYAPSKPDYAFDSNTVTVRDESGEVAIALSKKFVLRVNSINLGKAINDSVSIGVKRILPNGTAQEPVSIKVKPIYYKGSFELVLPNTDSTGAGINRFEITLDNTGLIDELNENNNVLVISHFLPRSGISLLAPMNYSIVNSPTVNLVVQSTQLRAEPKGVYFELDTSHVFNSGIKLTHQASPGVLPAWEVSLPIHKLDADSTVFFWRARFDKFEQGEDTVWVNGSFRYIKNNEGGWSQSHAGQYNEAELNGIRLSNSNKLEFSPVTKNFEIRTVGGDERFDMPPHGIYINGVSEIDAACGNFKASSVPRMFFFVLDSKNLNHVTVPGFSPCKFMWNLYQFGDLNNPTIRANMLRFLNAIPAGHYVVGVTVNKVPFDLFTPELKAAFRNIGSELIDEIKTGYPLAIIGQKGATVGSIQEIGANADGDIPPTAQGIVLRYLMQTTNTQGAITSSLIGPALSWGSLHHNIERYKAGNDSYKLSLYGINSEGNRDLLNDNITSKAFDLSQINAAQYPHLQLQAQLTDTEDRTAPQLKQWMVYYQAAPEGVIRPDLVEVSDEIITQQAGRGRIEMPMAFQNVTPYAFRDSITVEVTLTGEGIEPRVSRFKIEALEGNKTATFNHTLSTLDLDGSYKLSMYVNPQLQPEQQYQNNIYEVNFAVKSKLHPIMDVAFDGVHIMDGELVAPSPLISITMKDENKHVYLENADAMEVYLEGPNIQGQYDVKKEAKPGELHVSPADEKNDFRFEYKPEKLENGRYTLTVRGKDASGKDSGSKDYKINFEVENESKITNFYPYPNPFSTKTQFIFTLTGGVIPNDFKIQIMTVTGKIVKEILREEIGPIRIGNNKTEYAWDGTDMYGDKLANGVYLYRVVMPKDAEEMKHIWKKGDKGFVNGYGKIYILR